MEARGPQPGADRPDGEGSKSEKPQRGGGMASGGPERVERMFEALDVDGNGKISEGEARGPMKERFAMIDADGDGGISKDELVKVGRKLAERGRKSPGGREKESESRVGGDKPRRPPAE